MDTQSLPPFQVRNLRRIAYGSQLAEFDLDLPGVTLLGCRAVFPDGRQPFVSPPSICDNYSRRYVRTARLGDEVADAVLDDVIEKLGLALHRPRRLKAMPTTSAVGGGDTGRS